MWSAITFTANELIEALIAARPDPCDLEARDQWNRDVEAIADLLNSTNRYPFLKAVNPEEKTS